MENFSTAGASLANIHERLGDALIEPEVRRGKDQCLQPMYHVARFWNLSGARLVSFGIIAVSALLYHSRGRLVSTFCSLAIRSFLVDGRGYNDENLSLKRHFCKMKRPRIGGVKLLDT